LNLFRGDRNNSSFNLFLFFFNDYFFAFFHVFFYFCSLCLFYFHIFINYVFFPLAYLLFLFAFNFFYRFRLFIFFHFDHFWYFRRHDEELLGDLNPRWDLRLSLFKKILQQVSYFHWGKFITLSQD